MAKRSFTDSLATDEQLRIILKDAEPVVAPLYDCRTFSSVAKSLPDTNEWNLSDILINGEHVKRETVLQWLSALEQLTEHQQPAADGQSCTVSSLYELLAFADAVGSRRGLLMACISNLPRLRLYIAVGEQQLGLAIGSGGHYFRAPHKTVTSSSHDDDTASVEADSDRPFAFYRELLGDPNEVMLAQDLTQQQRESILAQVAQQLEQLLYMSYKLDLEPLIDRLHAIIRCNTVGAGYIIHERAEAILFTQRVLSALSASSHARKIWANSLLGEHCGLSKTCPNALFTAVDHALKPIKFAAVLQRDFMGECKGTAVTVRLNLLEGILSLSVDGAAEDPCNWYPCELRLAEPWSVFNS